MPETGIVAEPGKQEIVVTRVLDAPRERVFGLYTDPKRMPLWWGPRSLKATEVHADMRAGGAWRLVLRDSGGKEYTFRGTYHLVVPPELVVYTFEFDGLPGRVIFWSVRFAERGGKSVVTDRVVFRSAEDRDALLGQGMKESLDETWQRFAELLNRA